MLDNRGAVYTNLGPGKYRFEVTTVMEGSDPPVQSALAFEILPAFYQTRWFHALCAVLAVCAFALLFRIQLQRASTRLRDRLEARVHERERIARDLHDTLLQSMQGLIMRINSAVVQMPEHEASRENLREALGEAQQALIEGRDRVMALRESHVSDLDLTADIIKIGKGLAAEAPGVEFHCDVRGRASPLHPIVREEAFLIVRESLLNAFNHAQACRITTDVSFDRAAVCITVADDGRGIPPEVLETGGREGHWGMTGMRERAARIRGTVSIENDPTGGVRVQLRIPAAVAYRPTGRRREGLLPRYFQWQPKPHPIEPTEFQ